MLILDRKTPPAFNQFDKIKIMEASKYELNNGTPVYFINAGSENLVKIEFVFPAGSWYEQKRLAAFICNSMLDEGTTKHTAEEIANLIDFYGSVIELSTEMDSASVVLYSLNKHLFRVLPVLKEIITEPTFPEKELQTLKKNYIQELAVNNNKVAYLARKRFNEILFGRQHPYGLNPARQDYKNLQVFDLQKFYKQSYNYKNCKIVLSGRVSKSVLSLINNTFGMSNWGSKTPLKEINHIPKTSLQKKHFIEKRSANQSAIRIGKSLFNKTHPDYAGMLVLNTALGGYFGSRLMKNIREDKGYTYGIGSSMISLINGGYLFISTETGVNVCKNTIKEVYKEIKILHEKLIPEGEMTMIRNYMLGSFLSGIDSPFALAGKFRSIMLYGLNYDYYYQLLDTIKTISPEKLRNLCNQYLDEKSLYELVVGKYK